LNTFTPAGFGFRLEAFDFYMRTETAGTNPVYVAVIEANGNTLAEGNLTLATAPNGNFYNITVNPNLSFNDGQRFAILIRASRVIPFPAGADFDAAVRNQSFYLNPNTNQYVNLNTITGFENGAFIIRARGTKTGLSNQPPIARAALSKTQAQVNESISFDASTSSDPDGQITQYMWNFGDGAASNQRTTAHAYAQAGSFTYTLTVTDNGGATGQTSGQVTITATPTRLTVNPANGTVAPNGSETITVTFDAQGLAEGNYPGQLNITSNGGNRTLPVRITVSNTVKVDEPRHEVPHAFALEQNYPNPFNPSTRIQYNLPAPGEVYLRVYNLHGELVMTLVSGAQAAGEHVVYWDGRNHLGERVASGIYLYRLEAISNAGAATNLTRKLTLMK
jgi:PKD repeat protein